jgi:hypothetical protein
LLGIDWLSGLIGALLCVFGVVPATSSPRNACTAGISRTFPYRAYQGIFASVTGLKIAISGYFELKNRAAQNSGQCLRWELRFERLSN